METRYLFSYFKGHGDGLHLALSKDGYQWEALFHDEAIVKPKVGVEKIMRDPCLYPGPDGRFHLVWTCGWHEPGIGYAWSEDLLTWSDQYYLPVMEHDKNVRNCWAPEIFFDDVNQEYLIYWSSTIDGHFPETYPYGDDGLNHRIYCVTTRDFKQLSEAKLFYDPGFNVIDANIVRHDSEYLIFLKDETLTPARKHIRFARGKNLRNFDLPGGPITLDHYWAEGPTAIRIKNEWLVYFDKYKINEIGAVRTLDFVHWEDVSHLIQFPSGAQHGYVSEVPLKRINHLIQNGMSF